MAKATKIPASRPSFEDYADWHHKNLGEDVREASLRIWYEINVRNAKIAIQNHPFFGDLSASLLGMAKSGVLSRNQTFNPSLLEKSFESVINKAYRANVNWNRRFPNPPDGGWVKCADLFEKMDDLVRTLIVCRYIDGPEKVCRDMVAIAKKHGIEARATPKATDEGYYAHHVVAPFPVTILDRQTKAKDVNVLAEIQVTTQMQDVLRDLTHVYYEKNRLGPSKRRTAEMRWNFRSPDFRAEYLGHTLHLIEGIVAELRAEHNDDSAAEKTPRSSPEA